MNPIGNYIGQALSPVRDYRQKKQQQKRIPDYARAKIFVVFIDGNKCSFPSYDHHSYKLKDGSKVSRYSEKDGLKGLYQRIVAKYIKMGRLKEFEVYIDKSGRTGTNRSKPDAADYNFCIAKGNNVDLYEHPFLRFNPEDDRLDWKFISGHDDLRHILQENPTDRAAAIEKYKTEKIRLTLVA